MANKYTAFPHDIQKDLLSCFYKMCSICKVKCKQDDKITVACTCISTYVRKATGKHIEDTDSPSTYESTNSDNTTAVFFYHLHSHISSLITGGPNNWKSLGI